MAAPFSPRANAIFWIVLGCGIGAPAAGVTALMLYARSPLAREVNHLVEQPIAFDHRHHVSDDGIDCRYCHDLVTRSPYAGVPPASRCMGCHAQIWNESTKLELVRRSYFDGDRILWNRVHRLPDFVFFNHSSHVNKGVGCATCHGRVDQMAMVFRVSPLTMSWCLDCHRNPAPYLRPLGEITNMRWTPPASDPDFSRNLAAELDARPGTDCYTCHR